jgi:hypothetical protein
MSVKQLGVGASAAGNDAAYRESEDEQGDETVDEERLPLVSGAKVRPRER